MSISQEQEEQQQEREREYLDPYSTFKFAFNSLVSRNRYTTRLDKFFSFRGVEGNTIRERCKSFVEKAKKDNDWAFRNNKLLAVSKGTC